MKQIVPYLGIALGGMLALAGCSNNSTHAAPKPSAGKQTASNVLKAGAIPSKSAPPPTV